MTKNIIPIKNIIPEYETGNERDILIQRKYISFQRIVGQPNNKENKRQEKN